MSPLGAAISAWLSTAPGMIVAGTPDAVIGSANAKFSKISGVNITSSEFEAALDRAGYRPQPRKRAGSDDGACDWSINLPETR